jgi:sortase A
MRPGPELVRPARWRPRLAALAGALAVTAAAVGCSSSPARFDAADTVTALADSPVPVALPVTTASTLDLPVPLAPPDPDAPEPVVRLGTVEIPRLGLRLPLDEGITLGTLARGPGHWPGTAMPGQVGNVVVAGHRVTHTHPFRDIDELVPGDEVIFATGRGRYVYRMTGSEVVPPTGIHIVDQTAARTATLFACHPPGSAAYRYVVHLELVT